MIWGLCLFSSEILEKCVFFYTFFYLVLEGLRNDPLEIRFLDNSVWVPGKKFGSKIFQKLIFIAASRTYFLKNCINFLKRRLRCYFRAPRARKVSFFGAFGDKSVSLF